MKRFKAGCSAFIVVLSNSILAQTMTPSDELILRPRGSASVLLSLGSIMGVRGGIRLHPTDQTFVEISGGFVPFAWVFGLNAAFFGSSFNWYQRPGEPITATMHINVSYGSIVRLSDAHHMRVYLVSPMFGFDRLSDRGKSAVFFRFGGSLVWSTEGRPRLLPAGELGASMRIW